MGLICSFLGAKLQILILFFREQKARFTLSIFYRKGTNNHEKENYLPVNEPVDGPDGISDCRLFIVVPKSFVNY